MLIQLPNNDWVNPTGVTAIVLEDDQTVVWCDGTASCIDGDHREELAIRVNRACYG